MRRPGPRRSAARSTSLAATAERFGAIDHVAHSAATGSGKFGFPFTDLTPSAWPRVLEVNILGMVNIAHAPGPGDDRPPQGHVHLIASVARQMGSQTDPPYSASKAANINFAQCLAKDLAPHGVRVNTVCPGMVKTPLNRAIWQAWHDQEPAEQRLDFETWAVRRSERPCPWGTWQSPIDVANMAVFLASSRAGQITGFPPRPKPPAEPERRISGGRRGR